MMRKFRLKFLVVFLLGFTCLIFSSSAQTLVVQANKPGAKISPTLWGVFFEDINFSADGGLYAELVKNRSFEFADPWIGWDVIGRMKTEADVLIMNRQQAGSANQHYIEFTLHQNAERSIGLTNEGFRGIGIKANAEYDFSVLYKHTGSPIYFLVELVDTAGRIIGSSRTTVSSSVEWKKLNASFKTTASAENAKLNLWIEGDGIVDLDMISLFPKDTWKQRPGGLRSDMVQMLADMKPGFVRFPGGCIVEGYDLSQRYQWKKTIGPIEDRQVISNRWGREMRGVSRDDYFQSFGLGFFEYFQLCEDIGASPLPILNAGMACQGTTGELVPLDQLEPFVQDALDLIEFANGDPTTTWGRKRAEMGHPKPFQLTMIGIGNENFGPQYVERLSVFMQAIKAKYPKIRIVSSGGTGVDGERFRFLNDTLRKMNADFVDEHYYRSPNWFFSQANRYDNYPRNGSKVFAGEYAAHVDGKVGEAKNVWIAALAEAAFMTGLERNADVVEMASYAPLFAHLKSWQWAPDLIWMNNTQVYGTPSYHVQKLFSQNRGSFVVPISAKEKALTGSDSLYFSAATDTEKKEIVLKLVNVSAIEKNPTILLQGAGKLGSEARGIMINGNPNEMNSVNDPSALTPKNFLKKMQGTKLNLTLPPYSLTILRVSTY